MFFLHSYYDFVILDALSSIWGCFQIVAICRISLLTFLRCLPQFLVGPLFHHLMVYPRTIKLDTTSQQKLLTLTSSSLTIASPTSQHDFGLVIIASSQIYQLVYARSYQEKPPVMIGINESLALAFE